MSNWIIALFVAIPGAVWIYPKVTNKTGGNTQSALIVAVVAGVFIFLLCLTVFALIPG